MNHIVVGI